MKYTWNEEAGIAICELTVGDRIFIGDAFCADEDEDMKSEKVGMEIAEKRAFIDYFKHCRDNVIKPQLAALKHYYYCIKDSKKFNPKSYEVKMLKRQMAMLEDSLETVKQLIRQNRYELKRLIDTKEEMYQHIRKMREGQKETSKTE